MVGAGMDAARLNLSYGDHASHAGLIENLRKVSREKGRPIPIVLDLQGPRFRVGKLAEGHFDLRRGQEITLRSGRRGGTGIPIVPRYSFAGVQAGHRMGVGDLGIRLRVLSAGRGKLRCKVIKSGAVWSGNGVVFPESKSALPALTAKDLRDLKFGLTRQVTFVALSFVRSASDVKELRRRIGRHEVGIISKIETKEALQDIDAIIDSSDAILVARGDLAGEVSMSRVPLIQKMLIQKCNRRAKPVITATQMLESMVANPQPTRAEATDVANAVLDGSDVLMLSAETATGNYPVEAVKMMASIVRRTERAHLKGDLKRALSLAPEPEIADTIAYLAAGAARSLGARAIITFTMSGSTALRVAKFRPGVPIFAVSPSETTRLRLMLSYVTVCGEIRRTKGTDQMIEAAVASARARGMVKKGDVVVITAGVPPLTLGKTNLLKLEEVP